jgi:single-stranded-DNA-specific exonuclease
MKEEEIFGQAIREIEKNDLAQKAVIIVYGENWHLGVIGIVASKITRNYSRPAIVISIENDMAFGSARSLENINILDMLADSSEFLQRYGGHSMAAGLSLTRSNLEKFLRKFEESAEKRLCGVQLSPKINVDGELALTDIRREFFDVLPRLEPFGFGNANPIFRMNKLRLETLMPATPLHSRGVLSDTGGNKISFIAFNIAMDEFRSLSSLDAVVTPQMNKFRGETSPQLQIHDFRSSL